MLLSLLSIISSYMILNMILLISPGECAPNSTRIISKIIEMFPLRHALITTLPRLLLGSLDHLFPILILKIKFIFCFSYAFNCIMMKSAVARS